MCTLLFRHRPGDPYPLAVLSNRDEAYDRPSSGWEWREGPHPYFAPRDNIAGGTWIGLGETGVLAALTNIFPSLEGHDFSSRGSLVTEMLAQGSARKARRRMHALLKEHRYNKFNLLVGDGLEAHLFTWGGDELWEGRLNPGVYQVGNDPWDGQMIQGATGTNADWLEANSDILKSHPEVCKHGEKYGTRSSSMILLDGLNPRRSLVWHGEGPACEAAYVQVLAPSKAEL